MSAALDRSALDLRLRLGADALFSIDEAALLLPVPPELGRAWIEANVKQTRIAGVVSLRWADVLRAVEAAGTTDTSVDVSVDVLPSRWLSTQEAADLLGVSRATIDRAIARLAANRRPAQLPSRGKGSRVRYGWVGADALRAWWQGVTAEQGPVARATPKRKAKTSQEGVVDWSAVTRETRRKARG